MIKKVESNQLAIDLCYVGDYQIILINNVYDLHEHKPTSM